MTNTTLRGVTAALVLIAGLGSAAAQESTNVVATEGDWTVFAAENPKECWAVSPPKATQNTCSTSSFSGISVLPGSAAIECCSAEFAAT